MESLNTIKETLIQSQHEREETVPRNENKSGDTDR